MRIAVLADNLRVAGGLSVGTNVIQALHRVGDHHGYLLALPSGLGYESLFFPRRSKRLFANNASLKGQAQFYFSRLALAMRAFKPQVIWGLGNAGIIRPPCAQAIVVHNSHRVYPSLFAGSLTPWKRVQRLLRDCHLYLHLRHTQLVFCQTEAMRKRLAAKYSFRRRISLMPNAISAKTLAEETSERPEVIERHAGKFQLLTLTKYYPHKNLEGIVEVFHRHRRDLSDVVVFLTISPKQGHGARALMQRIHEKGLSSNLVCVGEVAQENLANWFKHCDGMLFPTLLESFSSTYLEAMYFGLPIITSDLDFARDLCGDSAIYCNPWDSWSIRAAILRLRKSSDLKSSLVAKGRRRLQELGRSWDVIVAQALKQLEGLVNGRWT